MDAFGHLLGWTDGNNVSTVMAYDQATGAPVGISSGIGQSSGVQQLTYTWDGYGNLEERQDNNQSTLYEKLTYDDLNRLSTSAVTNSAGNGPASQFNYNAVGNIISRTVAGVTSQYSYADASHPYAVTSATNVGGGTYSASYDADGNMITRNGYALTWTVDNLPASIAAAQGNSTFNYGPDDNRYSQSATFNGNTTATAYIGGLFEVVSTSTTTEYRHNILADGQVVAVHTITQSGSAYTDYLHSDHLESVDAITDDSGSVIQSMSFDAFGVRRDASNWDYDLSQATIATLKNYTDRGYTDQEELDNLSLVDLNGRVYDPTVGRMISADPTIPAPFFSQAYNRYSYVDNSPLENTDPSGFKDTPRPCPKPSAISNGGDASSRGADDCHTPETGTHIPGYNTGATCTGNCISFGGSGTPGHGGSQGSSSSSNTSTSSDTNTNISTGCTLVDCTDSASDDSTSIQLGKIFDNGCLCSLGSVPFSQLSSLFNNPSISLISETLTSDEMYLVAIIFAEGGPNKSNQTVVGWVVQNRYITEFDGDLTYEQVVMQGNQFAVVPFGDNTGSVLWALGDSGAAGFLGGALGQQYQQAMQVATGIIYGSIPDPTGGATFYYDTSLGNPPPGFFTHDLAQGKLTIYGTNGTFIYLGPPPLPVPPPH